MAAEFEQTFEALTRVMKKHARGLAAQADSATEFNVRGKKASPFPQHKGQPMWLGSVRVGKAYVSYHLTPLYMNPALAKMVSPALKKRMQGKACFNFKQEPEAELLAELSDLTLAAVKDWKAKGWL